ncbi:hypothetical protein LTR87_016882 [Friedmanniomyces endolithicus]|nr:hypothetical protein LTR87_016882 [Friedmanniomyces endolithicus]
MSSRCGNLYAASGDMRNVLETIRSVPQTYGKTVSVHINDKDFDIVARNLIITLAAFVAPDHAQAVDCMLHIWYSAMITPAHADFLQTKLRPLISDVVLKIERKAPDAVLGKTWIFSAETCRAELTKSQWDSLLPYFEVPAALTTERAQQIRTAITLTPECHDHRDRHLCAQKPAHRACLWEFREDGILLPFSSSREPFVVPNPCSIGYHRNGDLITDSCFSTFYQSDDWPMKDSADPLAGWSFPDILQVHSGPAANDLYGKLYIHIQERLVTFRQRLSMQRFVYLAGLFNTLLAARLPLIEGVLLILHMAGLFAIINPLWALIRGATFIFCIGDIDDVLASPTYEPFIQVFYDATQSNTGATVMTLILLVMLTSACIREFATASRQLWSFARDQGVPFSAWLSHVSPRWNIPIRVVLVSVVISTLLSFINIGSYVALNAINSLGVVSLLVSYTVTITCLVWRRLSGTPLPPRKWSLGRYGLTINLIGLTFVLPVLFFAFWPLART